MKRRLISFVLVAATVFSLVGTCLAADTDNDDTSAGSSSGIVPFDNRHYTETEIDPNWTYVMAFTITNEQARTRETLINALRNVLRLAGNTVPPAAMLTKVANLGILAGNASDPYHEWGRYTVAMKNKVIYEVDRLTGARHVQDRYEIYRVILDQNGNISTTEHTLHLK